MCLCTQILSKYFEKSVQAQTWTEVELSERLRVVSEKKKYIYIYI